MLPDPNKKIAGILTPLFALRGPLDLGCGDTAALSEMIQWASTQGVHAIQILPINETGGNHSPYNVLSAMALEPSTITTHPTWIPELTNNDYRKVTGGYDLSKLRTGNVNYTEVKKLKKELLTIAWQRFCKRDQRLGRSQLFKDFQEEHNYWLPNYTLYRALLEYYEENEDPSHWAPETRHASSAHEWLLTLPKKQQRHFAERRDFFAYVQWIAFSQWRKVSDLGDSLNVSLIGDVPVGVSPYGADVFASPELFCRDRFGGAPPEKIFQADPFTMKWGQNWGIPLYHWEQMSRDNFLWWRHRLRASRSIFHFLRVDHALGFFRIYSFPWHPERNDEFVSLSPEEAQQHTGGTLPCFSDYDDDTPEHREHNQRRGEMLLNLFLEEIGTHRLIAEDLGDVPPYVPTILSKLEIPGFKIPQWTRNSEGKLLMPEEYPRISVATYGTHDHPSLRSQWEEWQTEAQSTGPEAKEALNTLLELLHFIGRSDLAPFAPYDGEVHQALLKGLFATNSWLVIPIISDLFGISVQFNTPGSVGSQNWTTRLETPIARWNSKYPFLKSFLH